MPKKIIDLLRAVALLLELFLAPLLLWFLWCLLWEGLDPTGALARVGWRGLGISLAGSLVFWMWMLLFQSEQEHGGR